jgi:hypothetical protein
MRHAKLRVVLCAMLIVLPFTASVAAAKRIALVIGNSDYKETAALINTKQDAADMTAALKRLGFEVLSGVDLDKRAMERLIRQFEVALTNTDIALFFYAGHGIQVNGQNYLIPVDARLATEGDIDFESLPLKLVLTRMEREAKTSLVLLDACRDNPLARNLARSMGTRSTKVGQGLTQVETGVGTLIAFSTQPGNVALDGKDRNSPYTGALLRQIEKPGQDILTLLAAVRGDVVRETDGKQVPWEHTSLLGPVVLKAKQVAPAPPPPVAAPTPQSTEAERAWGEIRTSKSIPDLEAFIRRFGDTFYGDLAKTRLAQLKQSADAPLPAPKTAMVPPPETRAVPQPPAPLTTGTIAVPPEPRVAPQPPAPPAPPPAKTAVGPPPEPPRAAPRPPAPPAPKVAVAVPPEPRAAPPAAPPADARDQILAIQDGLRRVGCFAANSTGTWGPPTVSAAMRFNERSSQKIATHSPSAEAVALLEKITAPVCQPQPNPQPHPQPRRSSPPAPIQGVR